MQSVSKGIVLRLPNFGFTLQCVHVKDVSTASGFVASWRYDIVMTLHQWHIFFFFLYLYIVYLICTIQTYGDFLNYANFMQVFLKFFVIYNDSKYK